jgi:hypothetical protein
MIAKEIFLKDLDDQEMGSITIKTKSSNFSYENTDKIILEEESKYSITFKSKYNIDKLKFPTLESFKKDFEYEKIDNQTYHGTLYTGSYAGKSFFDVVVNDIGSTKVPFEVRSKKIDYEDHYPIMISELFEAASGILFDKSPIFEPQKLEEIVRKTFYEDFIFLEYLFRPENLINAYEHVRRDPHRVLERYEEPVPLVLAPNVGPSELISMVSDSSNLYKADKIPSSWPGNFKEYVPNELNQSYHRDIVDTPENRLVKYFLNLVNDLLDEMIKQVKKEKVEGYPADKIIDFKEIVTDYLMDGWLDDVDELKYFPSNSQVLQKKAGYRDILRFFMIFELAFFISWDEIEELIKGYQRKLHDLYEYWCYIKLFKILCHLSDDEPDYNKIFHKSRKKKWSVNLKRSSKHPQHFDINFNGETYHVELTYNHSFKKSDNVNHSYSLNFRPDYTLRIKKGSNSYLIHFDAKYRSNIIIEDIDMDTRDKEEEEKRIYKYADIYKMHTYKDAIVDSLGAYVLYPGDTSPKIFNEKKLQIIPSVGAFPLTPGSMDSNDEEEKIEKFIKDVLDSIHNNDFH